MDKTLRLKANQFEVNRQFMVIEEKIIQAQFDIMQKNDSYMSNIVQRWTEKEQYIERMEQEMSEKVDNRTMSEVFERINRLEQALEMDEQYSSSKSLGSISGEEEGSFDKDDSPQIKKMQTKR